MTDDDTPETPRVDPEVTVLAPEELDITADQHVVELDDGRYLISPSGELPSELPSAEESSIFATPEEPVAAGDPPTTSPDDAAAAPPAPTTPDASLDAEAVHDWLSDRLAAAGSRYGYDITAAFEGDVVHQELFSDDVLTAFENLLVWYAQHVGGETPVEDVLGILLSESTVPIRLPPNAVEALVEAHELGADDSLGTLLERVRRDGGLRLRGGGDD